LDPAELLDLIYNEVILREEIGESPLLDEYVKRFPAQEEALRTQFEVHEFLKSKDSFAGTLISSPHAPRSAVSSRHSTESATYSVQNQTEPDPDVSSGYHSVFLPDATRTTVDDAALDDAVHAPDPTWPRVDGFDILAVLGKGGMGTVYRALDRKSRRYVALKTINRVGATALVRFKNEFRTLLDVAHPNLVTLHELIGDGRNWFLTMELVEGVDFLRHLKAGAPPTDARTRLRAAIRQLAEGVAALHAAGKLHRDIKPSNVMVTPSGRVVLLDFGLAAEQGDDGQHKSTEEHLLGTAAYMAPEQAANSSVSAASDWYSVGVMLFEALTGRLPFLGNTLSVLMDKQRFEPPPPRELAPDVPEDLNALCVDLLRRLPDDRPSGRDILRRLGSSGPTDGQAPERSRPDPSSGPGAQGQRIPLVGRERHHQALTAALAQMRLGRTVAVYLHGPSGAGKTALVQNFLNEQIGTGNAVILTGRCYEGESVPYKALDSLIDALGRHLGRLNPAEANALLPRDIESLARVFPSLRRVEAVVQSPRRVLASPDPQELRRRAFSALRELFARLGDRTTLILAIDDLQWGDVDSAALLIELLRPPDAPLLLFLGTYRSEDRAYSPFLQALFDAQGLARAGSQDSGSTPSLDCRELAVDLLSHNEASTLASELLRATDPSQSAGQPDLVEAIARESGGNPLFVAELVRHVLAEPRTPLASQESQPLPGARTTESTMLALDEVLWSRIRRLPEDARRVLEVIAISGRPLRLAELNQSAQLAHDERVALALLRAGRLVRSTGRAETDEVETYHDRIREAVVSRLDGETARGHHHRLALALEASGHGDPEVVGLHFLASGLPERAAEFFIRAADAAAETLAFERAAALYRRALGLAPLHPRQEQSLRTRLGDALASAGRGADAAQAYLDAVAHASVADALELQRKAAMQFLISGHIDEGLSALKTVLATVDMTLPTTPTRSLMSLLWRRALLRMRGLKFRQRDLSEVAAADLTRLDVCWSAGVGLSVVDPIRGADFQARGLLLSLKAGEPSRIARSLALEAAHVASTGGSTRERSARLLKLAEDLARRVDDAYALAMVTLGHGVAAYLEGRWRDAQVECDRAESIFRDRCTGVAWELDTAHAFALWGLSHLGDIAELVRRWPILLTEARERGDLYAVMNLSTYLMSVARLASNEPESARADLHATMSHWSREGYHVQHNDALWAGVQIELYCGNGEAAWTLIRESWPALKGSLLLRVQFIRTSMYFLRARAALAAAAQLPQEPAVERRTLFSVASHAATKLEREHMPCPAAYALMIRGALAALGGDKPSAATLLVESIECFESVQMHLCAAAVRRRLGELIGEPRGRAEIARSEQWMTDQKIQDPARMASMILAKLS
jgi:tRNA A-37 threonylcarbamoyl transferase component Bud32/tetratricopeptide (TPR) repeat protein